MARWWEFAARFSEFNRRAHRALARQFKKHGGMDWRGGRHKDTALAKACTRGPPYVAKMLIQAGPCITGPGTGVVEMDIDDDDGMWKRMIEKRTPT